MLRSLTAKVRAGDAPTILTVGYGIMVAVVITFALFVWRYQTHAVAAGLATLQARFDTEMARNRVVEEARRAEFDDLRRGLVASIADLREMLERLERLYVNQRKAAPTKGKR